MIKYIFGAAASVTVFASGGMVDEARIHEAAEKADLAIVREEINKPNIDINSFDELGYTAVHCAAYSDNEEVIRELIKANADVNLPEGIAQPGYSNECYRASTLLMSAVRNGYVNAVRCLLEAGADVNIRDNKGNTALDLETTDEIRQLIEDHIFKTTRGNKTKSAVKR